MTLLLALIQALSLITAPTTGSTVQGTVTIAGTAASPTFDHYEIAFAYDPNATDTWFEIAPPNTAAVASGQLATWDTTSITDGTYMLRLRVFSTDSKTPTDVIVRNIQVRNNAPTPAVTNASASPEVTLSPTLPSLGGLTPTAETTAAVTVTPTGAPTLPPTTTAVPALNLPAFLDLSSYASAFCNGVYLMAAIFLVLGLYVVVRDKIRGPIRKWLRRVVSDIRKP